jgi:ElaB/YqjD/DUF883 family membrane-anchored ribosome-binding protein
MKNRHETSTAETPEQLIEHISRLMAEAEAMIAGPVTDQSDGRMADIRGRLESARERLNRVYTSARTNVVAGARYTDETIRAYPYQALGIALGVGVLLGFLIGRGRSEPRSYPY